MQGSEPPSEAEVQLQEFQAQAAMASIQLEIAKLEAEVMKMQSEAELNVAKAEEMTGVDPQIRIAEMQNKLQMKREELELRERLAGLTNQQRTDDSQTQAAARIAVAAMKPPGGK